ncbi:MAG: nucleoside hydrolase [Planctomycetia bacterium]|nr:nucleoside hydrolase [Planctomycetia bacterium]
MKTSLPPITRTALTLLTITLAILGRSLAAEEPGAAPADRLAVSAPGTPRPKIKLIYDGDIGPDPCDFTTLSLLHEYHRHGLIELLGVAGETPDPYLASTFSIYNQFYKNDVPIGAYNPKTWATTFSDAVVNRYQKAAREGCHAEQNKTIFEKYGNKATKTADDVVSPVELYRKLLSAAADNSVTIYAAGQLFNFPALLKSPADKISPLTGRQLVEAKVKEVVFMGGCFPDSKGNQFKGTEGAEWNWWAFGNRNTTKYTLETLASLGKPLTYIGWEQGIKIPIGRELTKRLGRNHPTTESYWLMRHVDPKATELPNDNPAYDDLGLFYAVEGGLGKYFQQVRGRVQVNEKGGDTWTPDKDGKEAYITVIPGQEQELRKILTDRISGK